MSSATLLGRRSARGLDGPPEGLNRLPEGRLHWRPTLGVMGREQRWDFLSVPATEGNLKTLTDGSIRVPAVIARTGIQIYRYDDGSEKREYRPPEQVFAPESMETWKGLSLTMGHPDIPVDPSNWGNVTVGHVGDQVKANGRFLQAEAIVKDDLAIQAIARGELVEVSCGYFADIDKTPGITPEGEPYDQVQRGIVGNHVALGPKGWGRAGADVRLLVGDSVEGERLPCAVAYPPGAMPKINPHTHKARARKDADTPNPPPANPDDATPKADAVCPECGATVTDGAATCDACGATLAKDAEGEPAAPEAPAEPPANVEAPVAAPSGDMVPAEALAQAEAERDAYKAKLEALLAQMQVVTQTEDSRVAKRVSLRIQALKADSNIKLFDSKGGLIPDNTLMIDVIKAKDPKFDSKGKDNAYIRARFDIACEGFGTPKPNANALAGIVANPRVDSEDDPIVKARAEMLRRNRDLAKPSIAKTK